MTWPKHAKGLFVIGILILIAGALPFLKDIGFIAEYIEMIPSTGLIYQVIIMVIGLVAIFLGKPVKEYRYY